MRGHVEILQSPATWFFTGTHRSQTHDYEEAKCEVQRFLKRLRKSEHKRTGERTVRYLMLPELHKSGAIHWHGLIHHGGTVSYRMVRSAWSAGFSFPSAVRNPEATAHYVTKYATKDMLGASIGGDGRNKRPRILASRSPTYGDAAIIRDPDLLVELAKSNKEHLHETWDKNLQQAIRQLEAGKKSRSAHRLALETEAAQGLNKN